MGYKNSDGEQVVLKLKTAIVYNEILAHFFFASPAFVCKTNPTKKNCKNYTPTEVKIKVLFALS